MNGRTPYHLPWAHYPALRLAVLFAAGVAFSEFCQIPLHVTAVLFILFSLIRFVCETITRKYLRIQFHILSLTSYLLLIFFWGCLWNHLANERDQARQKKLTLLEGLYNEPLAVEGEVLSLIRSGSGRPGMDIRVNHTQLNDVTWSHPYRLRLYKSGSQDEGWPVISGQQVEQGALIRAVVQIQELTDPSNPHEFDYRSYLIRQGVYRQGELLEIQSIRAGEKVLNWNRIRAPVHHNIERLFDDETVAIAKALITGYKEDMDSDSRQQFARAGLSHIMAVSGMHVGFVIAPFWLIMPWLRRFRYGNRVGIGVCLTALILYAGLTGFSASVCRASVMIGCLTVARFNRRSSNSLNLLGVSALIILMVDPAQLFDIGFQLSFTAVLVIILSLPLFRNLLPEGLRFGRTEKVINLLMISVVVQIGLLPLLLLYFNEFSITGPVANLFAVPLLSLSVPFSLLSIGVVELVPDALSLFRPLNTLPVKIIRDVAILFGSADAGWLEGRLESGWILVIWTSGIAFIGSMHLLKVRWKLLAVTLLSLCVYQLYQVSDKMTPAEMKIVMLDIGQGDAIYIKTPGGKHMMIDTGRWSPMSNSGESVLVPYLKSAGVDRMDAVILTHPHADHIGGIQAVMEQLDVGVIYSNGRTYESALYRDYQMLAAQKRIPEITVGAGDMINVDPSLKLFVLGPETGGLQSDPNNHSVVIKLVYNRQSLLFMGDAGMEQEERIRSVYGDFLRAGFLKIGHHGSRTSSGSQFLQTVNPGIAAASLAFTNRFGHPHSETVERIGKFSRDIYYTSLNGALVFETDGLTLKQVDWRTER